MQLEIGTRTQHPVQVGCYPLIEIGRGAISKMSASLETPTVQYAFRLGDTELPVNPLIGTRLRLEYLGEINCTHCGRYT